LAVLEFGHVRDAIRELVKRDPFVPFRLTLRSGKHYDVLDAESAGRLKAEVIVVFPEGERWAQVPRLHTVSIETRGDGRGRRNARRKRKQQRVRRRTDVRARTPLTEINGDDDCRTSRVGERGDVQVVYRVAGGGREVFRIASRVFVDTAGGIADVARRGQDRFLTCLRAGAHRQAVAARKSSSRLGIGAPLTPHVISSEISKSVVWRRRCIEAGCISGINGRYRNAKRKAYRGAT